MLRRFLVPILATVLTASALLAVGKLFALRFSKGDIYPANSSLRTDPLGSKALYTALSELDGLHVERNYRALDKMPISKDATLFYAGGDLYDLAIDWEDLRQFVAGGNRLVFAFDPSVAEFLRDEKGSAESHRRRRRRANSERRSQDSTPAASPKPEKADGKSKEPAAKEDDQQMDSPQSWRKVLEHLSLKLNREKEWETEKSLFALAKMEGIESELSWHTSLWFSSDRHDIRELYRCHEKLVAAELPLGKGTVVLLADPYCLSNEALRSERAPRFISFLVGKSHNLIFDEAHLGVREQHGVALLMRKYHLEGVAMMLAALAGLYIWQNAFPFIPRVRKSRKQAVVGRSAAEGLTNLLQRAIGPSNVVAVCVDEWSKTFGHANGNATTPEDKKHPVEQFNALASALEKKTR
jgi:hypothetical protein